MPSTAAFCDQSYKFQQTCCIDSVVPKYQQRTMSDMMNHLGRPETPTFRHTEFALQQIALAVANPIGKNHSYIVVNGSRFKYTVADGCVAMRILTAIHRGSRFTLSEKSVADIFARDDWNEQRDKYIRVSIRRGVEIQKEILSHLLGKDPVVFEERDGQGNTTSAVFSC